MNRRFSGSGLLHLAVLVLLLGSSFVTTVYASDDDSGYPGAFLRHGGSARSMALGEAGVTLDGGPTSMFYNPANLMRTDKALGLSFMTFSNQLVDGYSYFALSMSRMYNGDSTPLNLLFGPNSAWGLMFLDLSIDGIVQRSEFNELIGGDLSYYDQAFIMGFAHELVSSQGILDFGMNVKFVGQGFDGSGSYASSKWGMGVDLGLNYQPINPTLIKKFASLKMLLPLRLGLNIQNIISPEMGLGDETIDPDNANSEKLPTMVRTGFSYNLYDLMGENTKLLLVGDLDWMMERGEGNGSRGMGTYLGCEGQMTMGGATLAPRIGYNTVGGESKFAAGFGVGYPLKSFMMQFDFSQGFNEYLDNEQRIAFSIGMRGDRGAEYFRGADYRSSVSSRGGELRKLAAYSPQHQVAAARILAATEDTLNKVRYGAMIGGTYLARIQYDSMRDKFLAGDFSGGHSLAGGVTKAYKEVFEDSIGDVEPRDRVAYSEALLVSASGQSGDLDGDIDGILRMQDGSDFPEFKSERLYYLGVKNLIAKNYSVAAGNFKTCLAGSFDENRGLDDLAKFGHAQALLNSGNAKQAITILTKLKNKSDAAGGHLILNDDFPRVHPELELQVEDPFSDGDLADNVLFALGRCYGTSEKARFMYASVVRFYPDSDLAVKARKLVANPAYSEKN